MFDRCVHGWKEGKAGRQCSDLSMYSSYGEGLIDFRCAGTFGLACRASGKARQRETHGQSDGSGRSSSSSSSDSNRSTK